ncbi:MAG: eukaryotic-like serine/threonine-protein kinase [Acidobacteriota bacterium]|jgi:serine/threonine-protein kinase|nr:eukaryotic-like serine/threonine-protein kinase [Acidobacteriota bacterium]
MIGQVFGNYKIEQKLGEGGMGEVFRGLDMMLEREVAIKFLRPELASQAQVVERFRSEAKTLAKLNHPNIATLYSFMRAGDSFVMVLEFVRGVTLDHVIQQRGAIPVESAIPIFCQMLDGIQEAHDFGIIHRDIKPANMMLTDKGTLKVLDFGIARILGTARMTRQGNIIGTIEYMSPEQVRGFETDARSDIYSLGMLLYEMLTARCPFDIQNEFELMKAQIEQYPMPPRQLNPAIPEVVEQAIWRAIAKDPAQRYQSAAEFRAFLLNAGFAASGRTEPLAVGDPNAYGTRPTTPPPSSYPPSPFLTTPMQPGFLTQPQPGAGTPSNPGAQQQQGATVPSQPGLQSATAQGSNPGLDANDPLAATIINQPAAANRVNSKETRVGTAPPLANAAAGAKETRIGAPPRQPFMPPPPQGLAAQQHQVRPQSSGSKKWIYIAGAGVAVVVIFGVLVVGGAFVFLRGNNAPTPVKPAALAEQPAAPQPTTEQPTTPAAADATQPASDVQAPNGGTTTPPDTTALPSSGTKETPLTPIEAPASSGASTASSGSQGTSRTTTPRPAPPKPPKQNDSAEAARRKREAALRALDQ